MIIKLIKSSDNETLVSYPCFNLENIDW